ncbi:FRG domain-containing protein [Acinetobacter pittii]|uniref:FRG domain-containing protein n=1 Tax=Acinetobacter pittii TaxID=48296 RepID=UPI00280865E8|nr:FRG domain-containing protein [Acinetobacter baumannii]ELA8880789.1 FRG domain-containing protein [Acinetobacter baumannii]
MSAWNEFLGEIKSAQNELGNPEEIWYRGQSDPTWFLQPSLVRLTDWQKKEKILFEEFKKLSQGVLEKRNNDWDILFDMQHYWIPTRLLDWTTVLGVAIAFILHSDYTNVNDSAIYLLNPVALNELSGKQIIHVPEAGSRFEYKNIYWDNDPFKAERPIAIKPNTLNPRLKAQSGVFTIFGTLESNFEHTATSCYRKIILRAEAKAEAREFLKWANLNEFTIYPDIVGIANHIKSKVI